MSFSRAFSTRRNKPDIEISTPMFIGRAASQRGGKPVLRSQISSPMALVSTSNNQVHNADAIAGTLPIEIRNVSSGSSVSSASEDSDTSGFSINSRGTVTDASSIDESPINTEPEPNHLSCYFKPAVDTHSRSTSHAHTTSTSSRPSLDTPRIPQRVPSHSKRAHEVVHRKRSIQRMLSPPPSRGSHDVARSSTEIFDHSRTGQSSPTPFVEAPKESPFGKELAQLDMVAEEFGQVVRSAEADADAVYMESHGLAHFSASDYMSEIQSLVHDMFADEQATMPDFNFF